MGVACGLACHGAQAEAERGVEPGAADATVVEADRLALAILQEQLPVIGMGQRLAQQPRGRIAVEGGVRAIEKQGIRGGKRGQAGEGGGPGLS
jgi:hypothetical protein